MSVKEKFAFGASIVGVSLGCVSCSSNDKEPENAEQTKTEVMQEQHGAMYGQFKRSMRSLTPQVMLETILVEGVRLDDKGLCKPYKDSKGIWTIGFGLTSLDGEKVTQNTRHITIQEAWEKSVHFYEEKETYFFMWCYEIGIEGLNIDSQEKALGLASVMYNTNSSCIEDPKDQACHCNRNTELRKLYKQQGDSVTVEQVKALFCKYPVTKPRSLYNALNGGSVEDWANTMGNFCKEGHGIYWRRWLEAQIMMGNITAKDLLDLPMSSMADFWKVIGKDKTVLFTKNSKGVCKINPEGLKRFREWQKKPVDKHGNVIKRQTLRQVLNSIDSRLVNQVENASFDPKGQTNKDVFVVWPMNESDTVNVRYLNDNSVYAYRDSNYTKALQEAKTALKFSTTNKEFGASYYNMGMAYLAMGQYREAKECFAKSLSYNDTPAAQEKLNTAQTKLAAQRQERNKKAGSFALGLGCGLSLIGAAYGVRKYYLMRQKNFGRRR